MRKYAISFLISKPGFPEKIIIRKVKAPGIVEALNAGLNHKARKAGDRILSVGECR